MKINTKAVFEWNSKSKQYEEVYCDSYEYDGEVSKCQGWDQPPWMQGGMFGQGGMLGQGGGFMGSGGYGGGGVAQPPQAAQAFSRFPGMNATPQSGFPNLMPSYGNMSLNALPASGSFASAPSASVGAAAPSYAYAGGATEEFAAGLSGPSGTWKGGGQAASTAAAPGVASKASSFMGKYGGAMAVGGGALLGGITGFMQAKSQKKGLGAAIGELDPLKGKYMEAHERQLGLAESYRPGGKYSRYMGGQVMSQAAESAGQETQSMVASGITSPSMMRAMAKQSRRGAQASLPGMEMQLSQMALPYEQMGAQSLTQYGGVVEQLASLKGAKAAVNPWASALSGIGQGMQAGASMAATLAPLAMSDKRMKKDIKYLHTSNDGHKVYSFKYKDGDTKYSGVMAQDVLKINPNAVALKNGMLAVYYDMIDVNMQQLDII